MKDLFPRIISAIFYVSTILGSILYGYKSFILILIIFCVIIIIEYGKVLRKDIGHAKFIEQGSKYVQIPGFFLNTEFTPLCMIFIFGLLPLKNNVMSTELIQIIIGFSLFISLTISFIHLYCLFQNKQLFKYKILSKVWPLFGVIFSFIVIIYSILTYDFDNIKEIILSYLFLVWGIDSIGYLIGVNYGKTKLFESLSPKKTVEGAVASIIFSILYGILISLYIDINLILIVIFCIMTCFFAIIGDLVQSKIKRELNIKDFGKLLPGHGGVYDRLDSIIFSFPILYFIFIIYIEYVS